MGIRKVDSIKLFLENKAHPDLASLYYDGMECQVNVAQDDGERIEKTYKGKLWHGWQREVNGILEVWKPFRIPYNAATKPEFNLEEEMTFSLDAHAEGIGLTGWDWKYKISKWVAFDFDAIIGHKHSKGLSAEELENIKLLLSEFSWVTIRKSKSGKGLHIYIFLEGVPTDNHTQHSALARSILGKLSALTGFNFSSKVDICGGNMWVWHRQQAPDGFELVKKGGVLYEIPQNWEDHIDVVVNKRRKTPGISSTDNFEEMAGQRIIIPLDDEHKKLIKWLEEKGGNWWWDQDHYMMVCHTFDLKKAHEELDLKGIFDTASQGTDLNTPNAFAFPLRRGAWAVRRYNPGVQEVSSWEQDGNGWTRCFFNREPDFQLMARSNGGIEDTSGNFIFREAEIANKVLSSFGVNYTIPPKYATRSAKLKPHKDGRLILSIARDSHDEYIDGWVEKGKEWQRIFNTKSAEPIEPEVGNYDDTVRHLITESNDNSGWAIKTGNEWSKEPLPHITKALRSMGIETKAIDSVCGSCVMKPWKLVNRPFQPEYPGDRCWNTNAAQFRFLPLENKDNLRYPYWDQILRHCGSGLDTSIQTNKWCQDNGILSGADYLKVWLSSLFQEPTEPLPYLFFYGNQNSGKSIFHEAVQLLLTKGYIRAEHSLTNPSCYNGELEGAIICVVEEVDLGKNQVAYNRIKDWVTAKSINIRKLYSSPYLMPNTTHWIQVANEVAYCPIFPGDTRITMLYVCGFEKEIPKKHLITELQREAQAFLTDILSIQLPPVLGRLNVPVIITEDKKITEQLNASSLSQFIRDYTYPIPGSVISINEFFDRFREQLDPSELNKWTKIRMSKEMPMEYVKGRWWNNEEKTNHHCYGNISFSDKPSGRCKLICVNGQLTEQKAIIS